METDSPKTAEDEVLAQWKANFIAKHVDKVCPHASEHESWYEVTDLKYDGYGSFGYNVDACCDAFKILVLQMTTEERMYNPPKFQSYEAPKLQYERAPSAAEKRVDMPHTGGGNHHGHDSAPVLYDGHIVPSTEMTRSGIERWFEEVWNEHEVGRIRDWVSPDCKVHGSDGEPKIGPGEFETAYEALHKELPDIHVESKYHVVEYDKAGSVLMVTGTSKGGKRVQLTATTFSRWQDGKIVEAWNLADLDSTLLKSRN